MHTGKSSAVASPPPEPKVRLQAVSKSFLGTHSGTYFALKDVELAIEGGSFCCLLGPSGCGKTTVLNLIAGFDRPTDGAVTLGGAPIAGPGPDRAVVFQDVGSALFPWLTVRENIAFGPRMRRLPRAIYEPLVEQYGEVVGMAAHLDKFPFELSGGMKQRAQIARALVNEPEMLLMDEPFAALDAITKRILQNELARMWQATRKTIVYITHDLNEALLLGSRVAVMSAGPSAHIKAALAVDLPRPRDQGDVEFVRLQRHLESLIREEVERGEPGKIGARLRG